MAKTIQARIPLTLYNDILKIKRRMEKEHKERFGRKRPITFVKAAREYHRLRNQSFFGGKLI